MSRQRHKYEIPAGFNWNHVQDTYTHVDGRSWDSDTNEMRDKFGNVTPPAQASNETGEQMIQRFGLTAPRITPQDIDAAIVKEQFHIVPGTTSTVCTLTLRNGYTVHGTSACADPANFKEEVGQRFARDDAKRQIWPLLGYALRDKLHNSNDINGERK